MIGAGPAGCAAAYDLAAAGQRVLLFDRRRFPRTKPCAGGITIKTMRRLRYTIEPVIQRSCNEVVVGRRLEATTRFHGRRPVCVMTVRAEFDDYCLQRTIQRGAHFAVIPHIHGITQDRDGVTVETSAGSFRAGHLVGADGANSVVRRLVPGFAAMDHGFAIEARVSADSPPPMEFDFGVAEFGYGWLFPKRDHINVGLYTNAPDVPLNREALEQYARAKLGAVRLEHVVGHRIGLHGWNRQIASDRVLLAGDAAGLVDPLLGEGIHNAVASGQAAAEAIRSASEAGAEPATAYRRALGPMLHDLREAYRAATRFYRHVGFGYRVLTTAIVRTALMKAYARGLTFSAAKRQFLLLPFTSG